MLISLGHRAEEDMDRGLSLLDIPTERDDAAPRDDLGLDLIARPGNRLPVIELTTEDIKDEVSDGGLPRPIVTSDDVYSRMESLVVNRHSPIYDAKSAELKE